MQKKKGKKSSEADIFWSDPSLTVDRSTLLSRKREETKTVTRIDMHCHTRGSDGIGDPLDYVKGIEAAGIDGIVITDHHNTLTKAGLLVAATIRAAGYFCTLGCEYSTKQGHCLVYGVDVAELDLGFYPEMQELIDEVQSLGGVAFPSHPFRGYKYVLKDDIYKLKNLEHVETHNGQNEVSYPYANEDAVEAAKKMKLAGIGGSDAHRPERLGTTFTEFQGDIRTELDLIEALQKKACKAQINLTETLAQRRERRAGKWVTTSSSWSQVDARTKPKGVKLLNGAGQVVQTKTSNTEPKFPSLDTVQKPKQADGYGSVEEDALGSFYENDGIDETEDERIVRWSHDIFFDETDRQAAIRHFLTY